MPKFIIEINYPTIKLYENGGYVCNLTREELNELHNLCALKIQDYDVTEEMEDEDVNRN